MVTVSSTEPPRPDGTPKPPAGRGAEAAPAEPVAVSGAETAPEAAPAALPDAPPKEPRPPREASRLRRLLIVGGTILGLFIIYQVVVYFVAYTDDAYVRSDLVAVASEVTGPILKVHVVDNQDVKKGDRLFTIDP